MTLIDLQAASMISNLDDDNQGDISWATHLQPLQRIQTVTVKVDNNLPNSLVLPL